jgi:hypothetical protein
MLLKRANTAFREKNFKQALSFYEEALLMYPDMDFIIKQNIRMTKSKLNSVPIPMSSSKDDALSDKPVFVGIAAIPTRVDALKMVIDSLINQVGLIGVYLNGWSRIPDFLKHDKIIVEGMGKQDIGDIGKFYWVEKHKGIYFTCDDDLIYPKDYVSRTLSKLKEYGYTAAVGWHGSVIKDNFTEYYSKDSRRVFVST